MKRKLMLVLIAIFWSLQINAQTKQEVFTGIQKLVDKTKGEKVKSNDVFSKKDDKLGKQFFTEKEVTVSTIPGGKSDYEWISRSSEILWNDFFDYLIYTEFKNSNLQIVKLNFKKEFKNEHFTSKENGDTYPSTSSSFEFYILTSDKNELTQLLTRLYDLKEKKVESVFNAQINSFTKQQTLDWLKEQLKTHIRLGDMDSNGKIVSLDACNLVVTYRNLVRNYEEKLPTNIKTINKYGKFEYSTAIAGIRTTTPDRIDNGEQKNNITSSAVRIDNQDEEILENIEYALKHLAGFCSDKKNNDTSLNYIKDFFEANFVKSVVNENGKDKIYDYKIIDKAIIVYIRNLSKPTNVYASTNEWFYLAFDKINLNHYGSNLNYFDSVNAIRFSQINGYIPHGPGNNHTKVEDATHGSGWLYIPFRYTKYSDLYKFQEILTNANENE